MLKPGVKVAAVLCLVAGLITWEVFRLKSASQITRATKPEASSRTGCVPDEPAPSDAHPPTFTDLTDSLGIDFHHVVGPLGTYYMPESIGAGGALFDFDGDGRLDLYLLNCGRSPKAVGEFPPGTRTENRLFRQTESGTFDDVTDRSGLGDTGYGAGCAVGDIDNDGHPDVYVANYGADRLYRNNGDGTFSDVTHGIDHVNEDWGTCASFFDYDRDGRLDLFVANYTADPQYDHSVACGFRDGLVSYCGPHKFQPTVDRLFHNEGIQEGPSGEPFVRFREVTASIGLASATTYGFGVLCGDFNADHWPDIFVANDGDANRLWINQQGTGFVEEAGPRGVAFNGDGVPEAGMGVAAGDVDSDGNLDLVVSHLSMETTTLYLNSGAGAFVDASRQTGISDPTLRRTGWGTALIDLNHDGFLDLPTVNGLVIPCHSSFPFHGEDAFQLRVEEISDPAAYWHDYADLNVLLMGRPDERFAEFPGGDFTRAIASGRGLIYGDIDNDGDLDLVVTNCGSRARVYRNDFDRNGHWLSLRVIDPQRQRDAYGARLTVRCGSRRFHGIVNPGSSYLASNDPRVHFGLGPSDRYDEITIHWPDGDVESATESFPGGPADRFVILRRGAGQTETGTSQ